MLCMKIVFTFYFPEMPQTWPGLWTTQGIESLSTAPERYLRNAIGTLCDGSAGEGKESRALPVPVVPGLVGGCCTRRVPAAQMQKPSRALHQRQSFGHMHAQGSQHHHLPGMPCCFPKMLFTAVLHAPCIMQSSSAHAQLLIGLSMSIEHYAGMPEY